MREIKYKTHPVTLGELMLHARVAVNDYQALFELILARTDLTEEEAKALDIEELGIVMKGLAPAYAQSEALQQIGKSL